MTTKAKKLAMELLGIFQSHSERDIQEAFRLIKSGELLQKPIALARAAAAASRSGKPSRGATQVHSDTLQSDNFEYPDPDIASFARSAMRGEILSSSRELRAYGEILGVKLPQKPPSRASMVRRIASKLEQIPSIDRQNLLRISRSENRSESALKAWSDLIVKS